MYDFHWLLGITEWRADIQRTAEECRRTTRPRDKIVVLTKLLATQLDNERLGVVQAEKPLAFGALCHEVLTVRQLTEKHHTALYERPLLATSVADMIEYQCACLLYHVMKRRQLLGLLEVRPDPPTSHCLETLGVGVRTE